MAELILLNKPYAVLSQFTDTQQRKTLASYVNVAGFYAAGRLDYHSEGLILLTNDGYLQHRISHPKNKMSKTYWAQVEGTPDNEQLELLRNGLTLKDGPTLPAKVEQIGTPDGLWTRSPPVASHRVARSRWLRISIREGRNRQVRRMMAHVGLPVLRLIRCQIGTWSLDDLQPGQYRRQIVNLPKKRRS